jgi:hypothetical protein
MQVQDFGFGNCREVDTSAAGKTMSNIDSTMYQMHYYSISHHLATALISATVWRVASALGHGALTSLTSCWGAWPSIMPPSMTNSVPVM